MQAAGDLCGWRESLPLIAVVFRSLVTPARPLDLSCHGAQNRGSSHTSKHETDSHFSTRSRKKKNRRGGEREKKKKCFQTSTTAGSTQSFFTYVRARIASCGAAVCHRASRAMNVQCVSAQASGISRRNSINYNKVNPKNNIYKLLLNDTVFQCVCVRVCVIIQRGH